MHTLEGLNPFKSLRFIGPFSLLTVHHSQRIWIKRSGNSGHGAAKRRFPIEFIHSRDIPQPVHEFIPLCRKKDGIKMRKGVPQGFRDWLSSSL